MSALRYQPQASLNGRIVATDALSVLAVGDGFMYGHGLFETIRILRGQPVAFGEHFARLASSATVLKLGQMGSCEQLRARCAGVIAANALSEGSLKVILFQDVGSSGEIILSRDGLYPADIYARGFRLTVERMASRSPLAAHKTLNYFENIAAKRRAAEVGFDEPVFVDANGGLLEGATTNVFVVKNGCVFTPPLDGRILPGIVRARVIRLLEARVCEEPVGLGRLREADEVFVTNALLGVMPVSRADDCVYDLVANPITREVTKAVEASMAE